jgi:hypothetical protein
MSDAALNPRFSIAVEEDETHYHVFVYTVKDGVKAEYPTSIYHFDKHSGVAVNDLLVNAAPHLFA